METQEMPNSSSNLTQQNKAGDTTIAKFRIYNRMVINKRAWHKSRHIDQRNEIETPEINISIYYQLINK